MIKLSYEQWAAHCGALYLSDDKLDKDRAFIFMIHSQDQLDNVTTFIKNNTNPAKDYTVEELKELSGQIKLKLGDCTPKSYGWANPKAPSVAL